MSRGVASILGILCLVGGALVLFSVFKAQSITQTYDSFTKAGSQQPGTLQQQGATPGTSGGSNRFGSKSQ